MSAPDLAELRAQLRADVLEQLTKVGPRVDPGVLDKIATRIMVSVDSYATSNRLKVHEQAWAERFGELPT